MRPFRSLLVACLAVAFVALGALSQRGNTPAQRSDIVARITAELVSAPPAAAQQVRRGERRSLFRTLFGRKKVRRKAVRKRNAKKRRKTRRAKKRRVKKKRVVRRKKRSRKVTRRRAAATNAARAAAVADSDVVEKAEDARTVLVAGDFYANGLVDGLEVAFADQPNIAIVDRSNGLSGFVRTDIVNWPEAIGPMVEEVKPDYILFMGGANDRQLIREDGKKLEKLTPEWEVSYRKRIDSMGEALKATGVPFTWVGLPSVRFRGMSGDFLNFNEWYGAAAAKSPIGRFTDIWDGFADADGVYSRSGPDINGQITLLRRKDGINMTNAGERRLAFYVEGDVKKALEGVLPTPGLAGEFNGLAGNAVEQETYDPAKTGRTIVVNLDDPATDGAEVLAGETVNTSPRLLDGGPAIPTPGVQPAAVRREGRVDDYRWPPAAPGQPVTPASSVASN